MQSHPRPIDRCKCWGTTKVVVSIEHCPSMFSQVGNVLDGIIHYAMKETNLNLFGKVQISAATFEPTVDEER